MMVLVNENGYVESYALVGSLVGGIEVPVPEDIEHFENHFEAYGYSDSELHFNDVWQTMLEQEKEKEDIRLRREAECFSIVNRGQLWYDKLTDKQRKELEKWYDDWLKATTTKKIPSRPSWL